jgi:CDP-diacylglycerol--glycerol-3-phosphate 3-phosphatidyltransferase
VPNVVTGARLAATPALLLLAVLHEERLFGWLLVAALLSDIADGLIARSLRIESRLGAALDSTADALLFPVAAYGVWVFHRQVVDDHGVAFLVVLACWLGEYAVALWRYGKFSSFHTYLARIGAYALGIFVGALFLFGFQPLIMWVAVVTAVIASLEEFLLLWRLPEWRGNVRGLWWVLREQRSGASAESG